MLAIFRTGRVLGPEIRLWRAAGAVGLIVVVATITGMIYGRVG